MLSALLRQISAGRLRHHLHRHGGGVVAGVRLPAGPGLHGQAAHREAQRQPRHRLRRQPADVRRGRTLQEHPQSAGQGAAQDPRPDREPEPG